MKLNIFRVEVTDLEPLRAKLESVGMQVIHAEEQAGWSANFYFSESPDPRRIPWVNTYAPFFGGMTLPRNLTYYAVYLFERNDYAFALSYGKAHFYIRPFTDYDFGIDLAKRIANEEDTKQTASKRFQGRRKKDIKSYTANTRLDVESGESIDLLQASVILPKRDSFGSSGKFGASALLAPDINKDDIGAFLNDLVRELDEPERFKLPRTTIVSEVLEIEKLDAILVQELRDPIGTSDFAQNSFDLYGVDFVFSSDGVSTLKAPRHPKMELASLTMKDLKEYISSNSLSDEEILKIKVTHSPEEGPSYASELKGVLDFIVDTSRVVLDGGRWMYFNQDYLDFLDEYIRSIEVEETEPQFLQILETEPAFNISPGIQAAGYDIADKDFSIIATSSATPIEAWDLSRASTVYAVKFGTAQKLGYVCDQALAVLELLRNQASVKSVPNFERYCLWLGYRGVGLLDNIADSGSIILKQKVEAWARKARDLGIVPVLKISQKMRPGVDDVLPEALP